MNKNIKTLDLKKLAPFERHEKIFEMWNSLGNDEYLRIINDHEPKPLYYQFDAEHKGEFEWEYEQEGPQDWIFTIQKKQKNSNSQKEKIKELIKNIKSKEDLELVKEQGKNLLKNISPVDLGIIEQEIINEGVSRNDMKKLCTIHLEVMKENLGNKKLDLDRKHPIHTMMIEHKEILGFIENLKKSLIKLEKADNYNQVKIAIEMLRFASKHLVDADKHHKREEKVLFPVMKQYGVIEPPMIMLEEHEEIIPVKKSLNNTAIKAGKMPYKEFLKDVKRDSEYLIENLQEHIYKEDNILYPMALEIIPKKEWTEIKEKCDEIGYCCFSPDNVCD